MESRRLFHDEPDNRRIRLDSESGEAISNLPDPHAESCRYLTPRKSPDCSILRPKSLDSAGSASTGRTPHRKISKNLDPRDTNQRNRRAGECLLVRPPGFEFPDHLCDGLPGRWVGSPLDAPVLCPRPG